MKFNPRSSLLAGVAAMLGMGGSGHGTRVSVQLKLSGASEPYSHLPKGPGPRTYGIPRFPQRRSFIASRRAARSRRNTLKRVCAN